MAFGLNPNISKRSSFVILVIPFVFAFLCLLCLPVFAAFNITALPAEGGFDLRFGRISPADFKVSKEITINVASDSGKQYRVLQKVIQPLALTSGAEIPNSQFKMYALLNSNTRGTLIYREETPVSDFDTVLYTSSPIGDSDSFKLVYTLTPSENQMPGSYYGRIAYILEPLDSTQAQVVITVNIYAELASGTTPVIEVTTSTGTNRLTLSSKDMGPKKEPSFGVQSEVSFKVSAPLGATYRIYQSLQDGVVRSQEGDEFDLSNLSFAITGGDKGSATKEGSVRDASGRQLLYVSDSHGAPDEFTMTFIPGKNFRLAKPGLYKGRLDFIIETDSGTFFKNGVFQSLDLELDIVPLFDIFVISGGTEGVSLKFGEVSFKTGPKKSEVEIFVESNLGKPYQVIQRVASPMINENRDKIPQEDFTVRVKDLDVRQEAKFSLNEPAPAKEGETVLFDSGFLGEGTHFKVEYQLTMRPDTKPGNYSTKIGYSLLLE